MIARVLVLMLAALATGGCSDLGRIGDFTTFYLPRGDLSLRNPDDPDAVVMPGAFDIAVYSVQDPETAHVLLIEGTEDDPKQVVHIKMFWRPRAARTPFDPTATNTTVRYVIFDGDQVAIFGGGGLLRPNDIPGDDRWGGTLDNATLRLLDQTDKFDAGLGHTALAIGGFKAERDEMRTLALLRKVTGIVEDKLGYPRLVQTPAR
jgi:hypothetical protein